MSKEQVDDGKAGEEAGDSGDSKRNRVDEFIAHPQKAVWKLAVPVMLVSGALAFLFVQILGMGLESIWLALVLGAGITSTVATGWIWLRLNRLEREAEGLSQEARV